jgi:hypothetical protein
MSTLSRLLCLSAFAACFPVSVSAAPVTFFGEDLGQGESIRLSSHPNADAARAQFLSNLVGVGTATLESVNAGDVAPLVVDFGASGTATLQGNGSIVEVISGTNGFGRYPISGTKYWDTGSTFSLLFSQPQAAFGFYGVDIGDFSGQVTVTYANGSSQTLTIPNTVNGLGGSVLYFGFIDVVNPFTSVTFGNSAAGTDVFAFDDFTIGTPAQVGAAAIPTMAEWTMGAMALLFAGTAIFFIKRQKPGLRLG